MYTTDFQWKSLNILKRSLVTMLDKLRHKMTVDESIEELNKMLYGDFTIVN